MEKVNIRIFDAGEAGAVYQFLESGELQLVKNNSVVHYATPNRPANYNRIVELSGAYMSSYVKGTTEQIIEKGVEPLALVEKYSGSPEK